MRIDNDLMQKVQRALQQKYACTPDAIWPRGWMDVTHPSDLIRRVLEVYAEIEDGTNDLVFVIKPAYGGLRLYRWCLIDGDGRTIESTEDAYATRMGVVAAARTRRDEAYPGVRIVTENGNLVEEYDELHRSGVIPFAALKSKRASDAEILFDALIYGFERLITICRTADKTPRYAKNEVRADGERSHYGDRWATPKEAAEYWSQKLEEWIEAKKALLIERQAAEQEVEDQVEAMEEGMARLRASIDSALGRG